MPILLNGSKLVGFPLGSILMFSGVLGDLGIGWAVCDGTNGTPNLVSNFIMGTVTEIEIGDTGGSNDSVVVSHTHTFVGTELPAHLHAMNGYWQTTGDSGGARLHTGGSVHTGTTSGGIPTGTISTDGASAVNANVPSYAKLIYIQRIV